jgi:hypothetical protein
MTLGLSARVFRVLMAISRSSSSRPMLCIVLGCEASPSGGGVTMVAVFSFLYGVSIGRPGCFLFDLDFPISLALEEGLDSCCWLHKMCGGEIFWTTNCQRLFYGLRGYRTRLIRVALTPEQLQATGANEPVRSTSKSILPGLLCHLIFAPSSNGYVKFHYHAALIFVTLCT